MDWAADPWLDVLGWGGSALLVSSLLQERVLRFRVLNLVACLILIVFDGLLEVWPMVAVNSVLSAITIRFIAKLLRERHDDSAFQVLEAKPDDSYLRHVLQMHAQNSAGLPAGLRPVPDRARVGQRGVPGPEGRRDRGRRGDRDRGRHGARAARPRDSALPRLLRRRVRLAAQRPAHRWGIRRVVSSPLTGGAYYTASASGARDSWVQD